VILYGSRATGGAGAASDWDVVGIRTKGETVREARPLKDGWLDAFIHPEAHFEQLDEGALRFREGRVLVDREGYGAHLLARLTAFEEAGPPPFPPGEEAVLREWYPKMLDRIRRGRSEDVEADYRRAHLRFEALEGWFRLRRRWYRGPKKSLQWLKENEPAIHLTFARALAHAASDDDLTALVACVLAT
jgi:hypothetical protein